MLAKKERLNRREFELFFRSGLRFNSPTLSLVYTPRDTFHGAVVVGKKVYKSAVDRNRLRRQIYGVLYRQSRDQSLKGVYIIVAKPAINKVPQRRRSQEVLEILSQIK